jgi:hypothetical protein
MVTDVIAFIKNSNRVQILDFAFLRYVLETHFSSFCLAMRTQDTRDEEVHLNNVPACLRLFKEIMVIRQDEISLEAQAFYQGYTAKQSGGSKPKKQKVNHQPGATQAVRSQPTAQKSIEPHKVYCIPFLAQMLDIKKLGGRSMEEGCKKAAGSCKVDHPSPAVMHAEKPAILTFIRGSHYHLVTKPQDRNMLLRKMNSF